MMTFNGCPFSLYKPTYSQTEEMASVHVNIKFSVDNELIVMFHEASITDILGKSYFCKTEQVFSYAPSYKSFTIQFPFAQGTKKPLKKQMYLWMEFFTNQNIKLIVSYQYDLSLGEFVLTGINKQNMTVEEEEKFKSTIQREKVKNVEPVKAFPKVKVSINHGIEHEESTSGHDVYPGLKKYLDALETEKWYLKKEGGREYKVTNGKLLGYAKGLYSYVFDLESELFLSDDAPISVLVAGSYEKVPGTVLMCEDFQILVLLEKNIGEKIHSAKINVEPWKLLESLQKRISHPVRIKSPMVRSMLENGPQMATKRPISDIEKGQDAVIARATREPITVVWGPPGTGKTHTMSQLAINFVREGKSVLIVSHSNVSVDGVAKKIYQLLVDKQEHSLYQSGSILRYGYVRDEELGQNEYICSFKHAVSKCPDLNAKLEKLQSEYNEIKHRSGIASQKIVDIHQQINKIRSVIREQEAALVSQAKIVATTISKVTIDKLFEEKFYDVVMFDEVSMAYVPQIVAAATFAKEHFICVGDFMQLAPIAQSSAKNVLCEDIFTCLGINVNGTPYYHPWLVMLDEQRRMHPKISAFANTYVYHKLLKNHESVFSSREYIVESSPFEGHVVNYIDLSGTYCAASKNQDNSRFNILSAIVSCVTAVNTEKELLLKDENSSVSVITPYAAQTRLVRALIQDYRVHEKTKVRCATVHQFQGSESETIVFDAVESYPGAKVGFLMGKDMNSIKRLINVAVTRAKGKLITVGNAKFWNNLKTNPDHTFCRLQQYSLAKGNHVNIIDKSLHEYMNRISMSKTLCRYDGIHNYYPVLMQDFQKAQKIVISLPSGILHHDTEDEIYKLIVKAKLNGATVLIKSNDYASLPDKWKEFTWGTDNAVFPLIMIDDRITWYGLPEAKLTFTIDKSTSTTAVLNPVIRINGSFTAEIINSLCDLEYKETAGGLTRLLEKDSSSMPGTSIDMYGKGATGLAAYISQQIKCPHCKKSLKLKGKVGWCDQCKKTVLLSKEDINHYIYANNVKCPQDKCDIEAKLGPYGLYIKCDAGHYLNLDKI